MSNEEAGYGGSTRRTPRQGVGASPVGSWITVALAALAVLIGFLILRNITDDEAAGNDATTTSEPEESSAISLPPPDIPDATIPETSVAPDPRVLEGATVKVANANGLGGSAGNMSDELEAAGYTMDDPTDATGPDVADSVVYFDPAVASAEAVANTLASDLGGLDVLEAGESVPVADGDLGGAGVLLVLGENEAGKTIAELSEGGTTPPDPAAETTAETAAESEDAEG